jgi:hypothetical protein
MTVVPWPTAFVLAPQAMLFTPLAVATTPASLSAQMNARTGVVKLTGTTTMAKNRA